MRMMVHRAGHRVGQQISPRQLISRPHACTAIRSLPPTTSIVTISSQLKSRFGLEAISLEPTKCLLWAITAVAIIVALIKKSKNSSQQQPMTSTDDNQKPSPTSDHAHGQAKRKSDALGLLRSDTCALLEGEMLAREARRKLARIDQARHIVTAARGLHRGGLTGRLEAHKHLFLALIENRVCHSTFIPPLHPFPPPPNPQFTSPWAHPSPHLVTTRDLIDLYTLHLEAIMDELNVKGEGEGGGEGSAAFETQASKFSLGSREAQIVEMLGIEDAAEEIERRVIGRDQLQTISI